MNYYKPREDSYLTLKILSHINEKLNICIDIGSGECILTKYLINKCKMVVAIDININACYLCKFYDVLCSDGPSSVIKADLVVSNLPYLPPEEEPSDWETYAIYDYGLVNKVLRWAFAYRPKYLALTFSSLGREDFILEALEIFGEVLRVEQYHALFEDIKSVLVLSKF